MYLEEFYINTTPPTDPIHGGSCMHFKCKTTDKDIPVYVPCLIRDERRRQFQWWWNGPYQTIPDNKILDTGVDNDFKHYKSLESFYQFNFSPAAFGGYESFASEESAGYRSGVRGIIPKYSSIWYNKSKTYYISDRLIMDFNEEKRRMMTLDEAIIHCKEKENRGKTKCELEHRQLRLWLEELKRLKEKED